MFQVRTKSPFDDDWLARDDAMDDAAGIKQSFSGSDFCGRDRCWEVHGFAEALDLRDRLSAVPDVSVTIRER